MELNLVKCLPATVLLSASLWMAAPLSAAPLSFLNDTLAASVPSKDVPALREAIATVLSKEADHTSTEWVSTHNTRHGALQMVLTPQQTVQTKKAGTCRLLSIHAQKQQTEEHFQYWFCQQANGAWKASGNHVP